MSEYKTLSREDVAKLLENPGPESRAEAATKVAESFSSGNLSDSERAIAEDIFRTMVHDATVRVRAALSESLNKNPDVPHDVAVTLARDVDEVALPMITKSSVLTDEDLIEIVQNQSASAQKAVARRDRVSPGVADALVDTRNEDVVAELVANEGAEISEKTFEKVLDTFTGSDKIKRPLAHRDSLPLNVAERLVSMVSEQLRQHIMTHHEISNTTASDLLLEAREKATVSLLGPAKKNVDVIALVDQLYRNKRLTPSLVIRAVCMGDVTFFEAALARMVDIPVANAYRLIHDRGNLGLKRLFEAAGMPMDFIKVARAALDVEAEMRLTSGDDHAKYRNQMIERVLTALEDEFDTDNIDYLISKIVNTSKAGTSA